MPKFVDRSKKGRPYKPRIPKPKVQAIVDGRAAGKYKQDIAAEVGVAPDTVTRVLQYTCSDEELDEYRKKRWYDFLEMLPEALKATLAGLTQETPFKRAVIADKYYDRAEINPQQRGKTNPTLANQFDQAQKEKELERNEVYQEQFTTAILEQTYWQQKTFGTDGTSTVQKMEEQKERLRKKREAKEAAKAQEQTEQPPVSE